MYSLLFEQLPMPVVAILCFKMKLCVLVVAMLEELQSAMKPMEYGSPVSTDRMRVLWIDKAPRPLSP